MSDKLFDLIIYKFHQPWCTAYSEMEHYQIHTVFPQQLFVLQTKIGMESKFKKCSSSILTFFPCSVK